MAQKMTAYARKRLGNPNAWKFNGAEFLNTLQRCRPYTDEAMQSMQKPTRQEPSP